MALEPHSEVPTRVREKKLRSAFTVRYVRASVRRAADAELKLLRARQNVAPDSIEQYQLIASLADVVERIDSGNRRASVDTKALKRLSDRLEATLNDRQTQTQLGRRDTFVFGRRGAGGA